MTLMSPMTSSTRLVVIEGTLLRRGVTEPRAQPTQGDLGLCPLEGAHGGESRRVGPRASFEEEAQERGEHGVDGAVVHRLAGDLEYVVGPASLEHDRRDHTHEVDPRRADARVWPVDEHH